MSTHVRSFMFRWTHWPISSTGRFHFRKPALKEFIIERGIVVITFQFNQQSDKH